MRALKIALVVPSRLRSDTILRQTLRLVPNAIVTVDEAEMDAYLRVLPAKQLVPHPGPEALGPGLARIRNWIMDQWQSKCDVLVMLDDDIIAMSAMVGWRPRIYYDPQVVYEVIENAAYIASDGGFGVFGFNQQPKPLHFAPYAPLRLNGWVGTVIGFTQLGMTDLRYDPVVGHGDVDICLQSLMKHRIVLTMEQWCFINLRLTNKGGTAGMRTAESYEREHKAMKAKWGQYVNFRMAETTMITGIRVPRRS